jgi:hypothetical protein
MSSKNRSFKGKFLLLFLKCGPPIVHWHDLLLYRPSHENNHTILTILYHQANVVVLSCITNYQLQLKPTEERKDQQDF